ncbi:3-isopropylmalate dehydratase large subunit [Dehalogenimonas etheniformans]|uniref:3-isopropylmalate dehydratase large subunit n=1 Tax=Dehalogenimonas etheniformans TaxID=1536648 RepID=A0A2P5P669_9CHLR|nr:3-isopropylmalate dehydratase large subunit [Dehalogenimonas etheniformans]PPD57801.1 3-isopropylmalate dehydratase large subunit [Dehalogenimonas etheniformans]QNT76142.1 3-isopropylmalate dehydratase large subunit [Dehalogenimonas etheniformans]
MNLAEKILASHSGKDHVVPGEFISAKVDVVLANDITAPIAIREFKKLGVEKVFDPKKIVLVPDHFVPNKDIASAEQAKILRDFARSQEVNFFECGQMGIEHVILHEKGLVVPGDLVVGADSHTCTYGALGAFATGMGSTDIGVAMATGDVWMKVPPTIKFVYHGKLPKYIGGKDLILYTIGQIGVDGALYAAMEFSGEAIDDLSMEGRFTMSNMAIEAGGKAGLFFADKKAVEYAKNRSKRKPVVFAPDSDASYEAVHEYDVSKLEPQVALPHLPSNVKPVSHVGTIYLDQVVIGSCTNGRLEDLQVAAGILKGTKVNSNLRCIVIPGSQQVYLDAMHAGYIEVFIEAGCAVSTPTCGPCLGGHMGILAAGEKCLATTNRNFIGRMGSPKSEVYLAGPAVAAASAVAGKIVSPET